MADIRELLRDAAADPTVEPNIAGLRRRAARRRRSLQGGAVAAVAVMMVAVAVWRLPDPQQPSVVFEPGSPEVAPGQLAISVGVELSGAVSAVATIETTQLEPIDSGVLAHTLTIATSQPLELGRIMVDAQPTAGDGTLVVYGAATREDWEGGHTATPDRPAQERVFVEFAAATPGEYVVETPIEGGVIHLVYTVTAQGEPQAGPYDDTAEMRPDLMRIEPDEAEPGAVVRLHLPQQTQRGVAFVLEEQIGESWQLRYYLTAARQGEQTGDWQWAPVGEDYGWDRVGVGGPGPDIIAIPDTAPAGAYRICTANAAQNFCAPMRVTDPEIPAAQVERQPTPSPPPDTAPGNAPEQEEPVQQFHVTATVEVVDATAQVPFTVDVTSPGLVTTATEGSHEVGFTSIDGTVHLDDPRFVAELRDGEGRLRTAGPRCDTSGLCLGNLALVRTDEGQRTALVIQLGTADLGPGRYVLDQPVAWSSAEDPMEVDWHGNAPERQEPDGRATVRIVYEVAAAS